MNTYMFFFRVIAKALKHEYPSKFASKEVINNQEQFTIMQSLVAAYEVGYEVRNVSLCHRLFPCLPSKNDNNNNAEVRVNCPNMAHLCPGYSIGCGLCATFLPETCVMVCPFVGLYCGKLLCH